MWYLPSDNNKKNLRYLITYVPEPIFYLTNTLLENYLLWRFVRVTPTSALAWDRSGAALARSKRLNHYPVVAAYFWHVW